MCQWLSVSSKCQKKNQIEHLGGYETKRSVIYRARGKPDEETKLMDETGDITGNWEKTLGSKCILIEKWSFFRWRSFFAVSKTIQQQKSCYFCVRCFVRIAQSIKNCFLWWNVRLHAGTIHAAFHDTYLREFFECFIFGILWLCFQLSEDVVEPVVYALLCEKTQLVYESVIEELKKNPILATWCPTVLICGVLLVFKLNNENMFRFWSFDQNFIWKSISRNSCERMSVSLNPIVEKKGGET